MFLVALSLLGVELEKCPCHQLQKLVDPERRTSKSLGTWASGAKRSGHGVRRWIQEPPRMHSGFSCFGRRVWLGLCLRRELLRAGNKLWRLLSSRSPARGNASPAIATLCLVRGEEATALRGQRRCPEASAPSVGGSLGDGAEGTLRTLSCLQGLPQESPRAPTWAGLEATERQPPTHGRAYTPSEGQEGTGERGYCPDERQDQAPCQSVPLSRLLPRPCSEPRPASALERPRPRAGHTPPHMAQASCPNGTPTQPESDQSLPIP